MSLLYRLTRRLVNWRGGYRLSKLLIGYFGYSSPIEAEVLGNRMILDPQDHVCRSLLYYPQIFDVEERAALVPEIQEGDVFVDAGAHYGLYSLLAARRGARVLSIEADPETFARLEHNIAINRIQNIVAVNAGISDRPERLKLYRNEALGDRSGHSFVPGGGREDSVEVECGPLPDIMAAHGFDRCDVLKVDVEGFEYRVIEPFLERSKHPPRIVFIEYYPRRNTGDILALLQNHGYRLERKARANYLFRRGGEGNRTSVTGH
ncbi:MAG TPA: FkbM family methyltransferase [Candidatus Binataceae bacterium]|nr:FkbM family methyltransferase [Candidatus Binataceae bacterium]